MKSTFQQALKIFILCICTLALSQCKPTVQVQTTPTVIAEKKDSIKPVEKPITKISEDTVTIYAGFLMPFAFDENLKPAEDDLQPEELFAPSLPSIEFYEGAKMAADSFKNEFLKIQLKVYDIADTLQNQSLISGLKIYKNDVLFASNPLAINSIIKNAEKNNCPVIWTQSATVKSRQLMTSQPNNQSMIITMASYLARHFADAKITIVYRDTKKEKELGDWFAAQIDTAFIEENGDTIKVSKVNYSTAKLGGLLSKLNKSKKNLIVIPSSDEAFISPLLKALVDTTDIYNIQICGLPTWENFESVNVQDLQKLQTLIFTNNYVNYHDAELNEFRKSFIAKYATDPLYQAYQGFFLMKGFIKMKTIKKNWGDTEFTTLFNSELFNFNSQTPFQGYENTRVSVLKFENYKLIKQ